MITLSFLICMLYLFLIMPRVGKRKGIHLFEQYYYAHRGLHDLSTMRNKPGLARLAKDEGRPENSLAAFAAACEAGYGIEMDVQLTKDKIPVIFHDWTLDRVCHVPGRVRDFTYAELQQFSLNNTDQRIPLFEEVLALINGRVPILLEYKSEDSDMTICEICNRILCHYEGNYMIESFNPLVLRWYKKNRPRIIRGQLSANFNDEKTFFYHLKMFPFHHLLFNFIGKPDFVAFDWRARRSFSRRICKKLYHNPAIAWTIHSEEEIRFLRRSFDLFIFEGFRPKREPKEVH